MNIKRRYWLKGALVYTSVGIFALGVVFLLKIPIPVLAPFGPWWIMVAMDLGMRGSPASPEYIKLAIEMGVAGQIIFSSVVGSVGGWLYGKIKNRSIHTS